MVWEVLGLLWSSGGLQGRYEYETGVAIVPPAPAVCDW
jgi:hypothetical protein